MVRDTFYDVLEIPVTASTEDIQHAYRQLIQVWHPDRFQNNRELLKRAERKTKEINEAFRHLSDPRLKGQHDDLIKRNSIPNPPDAPASRESTQEVKTVICPNTSCRVGLRVPGKGKLRVSCPDCKATFMFDASLGTVWNVQIPGQHKANESYWTYRFGRYLGKAYNAAVPGPIKGVLRRPVSWIAATVILLVWLNSGNPVPPEPQSTSPSTALSSDRIDSLNPNGQPLQLKPVEPVKRIEAKPLEPIPPLPPIHPRKIKIRDTEPPRVDDIESVTSTDQTADKNTQVGTSQSIRSDPHVGGKVSVSLVTGTRIGRYDIPNGRGSLRIINGTNDDAVVKLGEYGKYGRLLASVYIKAKEDITLKDIGQGSYRLAFALGRNWNEQAKHFNEDKSYAAFDEVLRFTENEEVQRVSTDDGVQVRKSIEAVEGTLTLHSVPHGNMKTTTLDEGAFDRLFEATN